MRPFNFHRAGWLLLGSILVLPAWGGQTPSEIKEAPARPSPSVSPGDEFVQMDTDHDGRVSATEYAASPQSAIDRIAAGKRQGPAGITGGFDFRNNEGRPGRSKFFRKLDKNHDGYLSRSEL